jgi:hypothetical protein
MKTLMNGPWIRMKMTMARKRSRSIDLAGRRMIEAITMKTIEVISAISVRYWEGVIGLRFCVISDRMLSGIVYPWL